MRNRLRFKRYQIRVHVGELISDKAGTAQQNIFRKYPFWQVLLFAGKGIFVVQLSNYFSHEFPTPDGDAKSKTLHIVVIDN